MYTDGSVTKDLIVYTDGSVTKDLIVYTDGSVTTDLIACTDGSVTGQGGASLSSKVRVSSMKTLQPIRSQPPA